MDLHSTLRCLRDADDRRAEESVGFAGLAVSGTGSNRTGGGFRGKGPHPGAYPHLRSVLPEKGQGFR